ncbi:mycothiol system anti-sigma-R factor [Corynebacterium uterequi]|uniref:Anti-sigma factor, TIGR02949 family n=1 Tax=Corynebacterium uterequi TaxID=1072256 RepID=A0A0G3HEZ2_9CORY|nr:mycothiol system anti-sigma-R factor [Corynebacterium uterequi]AKK10538.1 anti-sigma factor, TIGR02949 family [Corynebacterium uterequi]
MSACDGGCEDMQRLLWEVLAPGTPRPRCEELRALIAACPECVEQLASEQEIRLLMQRCCGEVHAPVYLRERITTRIRIIRGS